MRSTSENYDVLNLRDDIYLVFTIKSKFHFYFIIFRGFTVNRLTMLKAKTQWNEKLQKIVCDRIPAAS